MQTPEATVNIQTGPSPQLLEEAKRNHMLAYMIKNGYPLDRKTWIELNWAGETPNPWTIEDEEQLPPSFQRA